MASKKPRIKALFIHQENDDSKRICSILRASVRAAFDVKRVTLLKDGMEALKEEQWDIVLSNLSLEDSLPQKTFNKIHHTYPDVPILLLIDAEDEDHAIEAMKHGAQEYVITHLVTPRAMVRAIFYTIEKIANERALELERQLLHNLMENIPDHIYFKDRQSRFIRINRALAEAQGMKNPCEAIGKTDFDFFDVTHAQTAFDDEQKIIQEGIPVCNKIENEVTLGQKSCWVLTNKMPLLDDKGNITGTFGISHDITRIKEIEEVVKRDRERLRVLTDQLQERNDQLEEDLRTAREIQQAFIPNAPMTIKSEGMPISFYPFYKPATTVGGDFFSFIPIDNHRAGLFLCDVMGHGLRAALVTGIVRGLVEKLSKLAASPSKFLSEINRALRSVFSSQEESTLVSAIFIQIDSRDESIQICHAGHPEPILLDHTNKQTSIFRIPNQDKGPVMGILDDIDYPTSTFPFVPGYSVVAYTDGVIEASNTENKEFGKEGLMNSLSRASDLPTYEMLNSVVSDMNDMTGKIDFDDDVCLVAIEFEH
ncbi:MAG: SpoIIE family protein phosphatase [Bacteroidota bacterium]